MPNVDDLLGANTVDALLSKSETVTDLLDTEPTTVDKILGTPLKAAAALDASITAADVGVGTTVARLSDIGPRPHSWRQHQLEMERASVLGYDVPKVYAFSLHPKPGQLSPEARARAELDAQRQMLRDSLTAPGLGFAEGGRQRADEFLQMSKATPGFETPAKVASLVGGALPYFAEAAIPLAGPAITVAHGGAQSGGETWQQAYDALRKQGLPDEQAKVEADKISAGIGLGSAGVFAMLPGPGRSVAAKLVGTRFAARPIVQAAARGGAVSAQGGTVMATDALQRDFQSKATFAPDLPISKIASDAMTAFGTGAAFGGVTHGIGEITARGPGPLEPERPPAGEDELPPAPTPKAPTAAPAEPRQPPTVPETPQTLDAQLEWLSEGKRPAVFVPPETAMPRVPDGFKTFTASEGRFIYDPKQTSEAEIQSALQQGTIGDLLNYGIPSKPMPGTEVGVVTVRSAEGTEKQAVVTDAASLPAVVTAADQVADKADVVQLESPAAVTSKRLNPRGGDDRPPDILDWISDNFPHGVKVSSPADYGDYVSQYHDALKEMKPRERELIQTRRGKAFLSLERGESAGNVIKAMHDEGVYRGIETEDQLYDAMNRAADGRRGYIAEASKPFAPIEPEFDPQNAPYNMVLAAMGDDRPGQNAQWLAANLGDLQKDLPGAPALKLVQSVKDLPAAVRADIEAMAAAGKKVRGTLADDGNIYLIADHIPDVDTARTTYLEESLGHAGMEPLVKPGETEALFDLIHQGAPEKAAQIARTYGHDLKSPQGRADFVGEFVAKASDWFLQKPNLYRRIVDFLTRTAGRVGWLRNIAPKAVLDATMRGLARKGEARLADQARSAAARPRNAIGAEASQPDNSTRPRYSLAEDDPAERAFTEKLRLARDVADGIKENIQNTTYTRRTNENDAQLAARLIEESGSVYRAINLFGDKNADIPGSVRGLMGQLIIKQLSAEGRLDDAVAFHDNYFAQHITEVAQTLQAQNAWLALTPEGQVIWARRKLQRAGEDMLAPVKPHLDEAQAELQRLNADGIRATTADRDVQTAARPAIDNAVATSPETHRFIAAEVIGKLSELPQVRQQIVEKIRSMLQQAAPAKLKEYWQRIAERGASQLLSALDQGLRGAGQRIAGSVDEFGAQLTQVLREQLDAALGVSPARPEPTRTWLQRLVTMTGNAERMSQIWSQVRDAALSKYEREYNQLHDLWQRDITDEAVKQELVNARDRLFKAREVLNRPMEVWSEKLLANVIREQMESAGARIAALAKQPDGNAAFGKVLVDRIVAATGLDEQAAGGLAKSLEASYVKMVEAERAAMTERLQAARKREASRDQRIRQTRSLPPREMDAAVQRLAAAANRAAAKPAVQEFYQRLTAGLRQLLPAEGAAAGLTDLQRLREVFTNFDRYESVWQRLGDALRARHGVEGLADVQGVLGKLTPDALVESPLDRMIRAKLRETRTNLGRIVTEHFTAQQRIGQHLADALVREAGVTGDVAARLAETVQRRFEALTRDRKQAALNQLLNPVTRRGIAKPDLVDRLVKLSNLGAFAEKQYWDAVREKLDLPAWTPELQAQLKGIADKIAAIPEDRIEAQQKALTEYMTAVERARGIDNLDLGLAFYISNLLSGLTTHARVAIHTSANLIGALSTEVGRAVASGRLDDIPLLFEGAGRGLARSLTEQVDILRTGIRTGSVVQRIRGSGALEMARFGESGGVPLAGKGLVSRAAKVALESKLAKILNLWKYNQRLVTAQHVLYFKPAEEMKVALLTSRLARSEGLSGKAAADQARLILGYGAAAWREARAQAEREGLSGLDARRRAGEILSARRPLAVREPALQYALRQTFLNEPYGFVGAMADAVAKAKASEHRGLAVAARIVAPFTRIAANIFNEGLNYTPAGAARAAFSRQKLLGESLADLTVANQRDIRHELYAKATLGTALLGGIALAAARNLGSPDPSFTIYGSGPSETKDKERWRTLGAIPYSIKVGGRYISYANTPGNVFLAALGNYLDKVRDAKLYGRAPAERVADSVPQSAAVALVGAGKVVTEQPFLQSLMEVASLSSEQNPELSARQFEKSIVRTASSFVVPNLLRQVDRFFDPTAYAQKDLHGILVNAVPFARRSGRPVLNSLGLPVQSPLASFMTSKTTTEPLVKRLNEAGIWPTTPERFKPIGGVPMNDEELYDFTKFRGEKLRELLTDPQYQFEAHLKEGQAAQATLQSQVSTELDAMRRAYLQRTADSLPQTILNRYQTAAEAYAESRILKQRGVSPSR